MWEKSVMEMIHINSDVKHRGYTYELYMIFTIKAIWEAN